MTGFVLRALISAVGLWIATRLVSGIWIADATTLVLAGALLGIVNAIVRPIAILLTLPITILSLGFFLLVVNAGMVALVAAHSARVSHPRRFLVRVRHRTHCLDHRLGGLVAHRAARQDRRLRAQALTLGGSAARGGAFSSCTTLRVGGLRLTFIARNRSKMARLIFCCASA